MKRLVQSLKQFGTGSLSPNAISGLYDCLSKVNPEFAHKFLILVQSGKPVFPQLGVSFDLFRKGNFGAGIGVSTDGALLLDANYKIENETIEFADFYIHGGLSYSIKGKNTGIFAGFEVKF